MYLFLDSETTGFPAGGDAVHMVELAWILTDTTGVIKASSDLIVKPKSFVIPAKVAEIHGITQEVALAEGHDLAAVMALVSGVLAFTPIIVGHNIGFDVKVLRKESERLSWPDCTYGLEILDTMTSSADLCDIRPPSLGGKVKKPKLEELYRRLFDCEFEHQHQALADTEAVMACFWELRRWGVM